MNGSKDSPYLIYLLTLSCICFPCTKSLTKRKEIDRLVYGDGRSNITEALTLNLYQRGRLYRSKEEVRRRSVDNVVKLLPSNNVYFVQHENRRRKKKAKRLQTIRQILARVKGMEAGVKLVKRRPANSIITFGLDDRKRVPFWKLRQFPYFNVVRLSSGCTGTLLTPSYVLTAAHCVHDGEGFKENIEKLKIKVPSNLGFRIHYAREIVVPYLWIKHEQPRIPAIYRVAYDYAVIKLSISVYGRHDFMPLHVPSEESFYHEKLYFLGYPFYANALYKSKCVSDTNLLYFHRNILLNKCDSTSGNSGASIFMENSRLGEYKIIGVLSSLKATQTKSLVFSRYTSFSLMTESKVNDICTIIAPEGEEFGVCPSYENDNKIPNRIFYG